MKCSCVDCVFKYITIKQKIKKTKPPAKGKFLQYKTPEEAETESLPGSSNRDAQKATSIRTVTETTNAPCRLGQKPGLTSKQMPAVEGSLPIKGAGESYSNHCMEI